jgi:hypothetical protein
MKVGIRFSDNDFTSDIQSFMWIFVLPTFSDGKTHLTSDAIVDLFNSHFPTMKAYLDWYYSTDFSKSKPIGVQKHEYSEISVSDIYWDGETDQFIRNWEENNNSEFVWTDGIDVYIS